MLALIGLGAIGMVLVMSFAWALQRLTGNAGWVDAVWSFGTGALGAFLALGPVDDSGIISPRQAFVAALVLIWSIRLGSHIAFRVRAHGAEDARYAKLRQEWGHNFQFRLFLFLQSQAIASIVLTLSILVAAHNPAPGLGLADFAGLAILIVAILGEGTADRQLNAFKADPGNRGKICDIGLWGWSRHPNYFFEWLGWLAYPLLGLSLGGGYWLGLLSLVAPISMYVILVHLSGVPPLEAQMLASRGDAFRAYQRRTPAFFPFPPRKGSL